MNESIFREYDVRGNADAELTDDICWALGRALAVRIRDAGDRNAYIGRDVRLSSPRIASSLAAGLKAGGINVHIHTPGPTPLLYFCAHESLPDFPSRSGIMVTGSHNPPEYNGFKMVIGGKTLFGSDIQALKSEVKDCLDQVPNRGIRGDFEPCDRSEDYVDYLRRTIHVRRRIKVVVDAGNGAAGQLGVDTYRALGCDVIPLFCEPDGRFPNHHPDPTVPKNLEHLITKVRESGAELGIAFDGDGDRVGAVTATGRILFGDQLVLYFARDILAEVPGATIISEVKSSQVLYDTLAKWGAKGILWKTGHSLIKAKLKETGAMLAGEMSGHIFFAHRFFGFDDAVYAGARLLEGVSRRNETLDAFLDSLPPAVNTPEIRVDCPDDKKFGVVELFTSLAKKKWGNDAVNNIDGARIQMHGGWGLLRASNTQPVLVMRFEGPNQAALKLIRDDFAGLLESVDPEVRVP